jgi:hypothetical protein
MTRLKGMVLHNLTVAKSRRAQNPVPGHGPVATGAPLVGEALVL